MTEAKTSIKESLQGTLSFLASVAQQREFAAKVPYDCYQDEFAHWWFDTFLPAEASVSHLFSKPKLAALQSFSEVFKLNIDSLASINLAIEELQSTPQWQAVIARANEALTDLQGAT